MNLHALVAPAVSAINPMVVASLALSNGYSTDASGLQVPEYLPAQSIRAQVQALTYKDLVQLDGVNLQGQAHGIYVTGDIQGLLRQDRKGGDLITLPDGTVWLVVHVLENWFVTSGWAKVAAVQQMP